MERGNEVAPGAEGTGYSKSFLEKSRLVSLEIGQKIESEMRQPFHSDTKINQPVIKVELFAKEVAELVLRGEDIKSKGISKILDNFILSYSISDYAASDYLWSALVESGMPDSDLEIISERIAELQRAGQPLKTELIVKSLDISKN